MGKIVKEQKVALKILFILYLLTSVYYGSGVLLNINAITAAPPFCTALLEPKKVFICSVPLFCNYLPSLTFGVVGFYPTPFALGSVSLFVMPASSQT